MPNKAKNMRRGASQVKLHAGGAIRFGFMRQNNLSGRTLSVTDVNSYLFDRDSFASYQLRDEDTDINMIMAEGERPQDAYLVLSLQLKDKWLASLFPETSPKQWVMLKPDDKVKVDTDAVIMPQGWLVNSYRHMLTTKGHKVAGDFRHSKHSELTEYYADAFDYVLLVSETGEYAIELERYENGTMRVYATVYRPISDISESIQFHRPYIVTNNTAEETAKKDSATSSDAEFIEIVAEPTRSPAPLALVSVSMPEQATSPTVEATLKVEERRESVTTGISKPANESGTSAQQPIFNQMLREELDKPLETPIVQQANTTSQPQQPQPAVPHNLLTCDALLASNLIEEARRNKLSMADVIRKVIDLPRKHDDRVYIPFDLTSEEYAALARRYDVGNEDKNAVQQKIVEELRQFAGLE